MIGIHDQDHHYGEWSDDNRKAELSQKANTGMVSGMIHVIWFIYGWSQRINPIYEPYDMAYINKNFDKELMKLCLLLDKKSDCLQTVFETDYFWK